MRVLFLCLLSFQLLACPLEHLPESDQAIQYSRVNEMIEHLVATTHPTLSSVSISLFKINNPEYFLISNFTLGRVFLGRHNYRVGLNPVLFEQGVSDLALEGILAHELVHTEDYRSGSTLGTLLPIGLKISFSKTRIQYERKTDLRTVMKGYGAGLKAYKAFQYPLLSPRNLQKKKAEYLTPIEIDFVEVMPESYHKDWLANQIPTKIEQFRIYHWFRKSYPDYQAQNHHEFSDIYEMKAVKGLKNQKLNVIPVTRTGQLKFMSERSWDVRRNKTKKVNISPFTAGYILYNSDLSVVHFHEVQP